MCRMRNLTISMGLILGLVSSLICGMGAENKALAAQADPIQAGYVIITPTGDNTAGLMAFETFGQKEGPGSTQAGVLPASMTKNAMLFVSTSGRLSRNLGVAIANPGDADADVSISLRGADGVLVASKSVPVAAHKQVSEFVTQIFEDKSAVPSDLTGTISLVSETPVAIVGLRFRGNNFSTLPCISLSAPEDVPAPETGVGGPGAVILPQFASGGGWATEIVLVNTGIAELTVRVDIYGQNGDPLVTTLNSESKSSFTDIKIPVGGVVTLAPRDSSGDSSF